MSSCTNSNNNVFAVFYNMLGEIKQSSAHNPASNTVVRDGDSIRQLLTAVETPYIPFSGEEGFGKYLDLHEFYNRYTNSKFGRFLTYIDYLDKFPGLDDENTIPSKFKATLEYRVYIKDVLEYLISFMDRAHPLTFLDRVFKNLEEQCSSKKRPRLEVDRRDLKKEHHVEETALVEAKVRKICEMLSDTLEQTRQHVQNKQAMTDRERKTEVEDEENDVGYDNEDDDDDMEMSNPLKLPMGWDGKPIPYWLYKLHGLNQDFKCEICGDHTYSGRRDFEKHFREARHQHGMRCLGIPYTKSFHEITSIRDALNLWDHIQKNQRLSTWRPEVDEEFEDADGNIYDSKTFTYLAKQGLI
ncbi:hypothetical protein RND81_09G118700 [Saponaria officinalis]|uniref:Matrin-type domain-containing protein n=1 Tax=Saponaria officinalis TaxID=3572 RepID=A0AAW1ILH4_SAPOF